LKKGSKSSDIAALQTEEEEAVSGIQKDLDRRTGVVDAQTGKNLVGLQGYRRSMQGL